MTVGVVDDRAFTAVRRRIRLRAGLERACEQLGSGILSHPDNGALRANIQDGSTSETALFARVFELVASITVRALIEQRGIVTNPRPSPPTESEWSDLLRHLQRAHEGVFGSVFDALDGVFCAQDTIAEHARLSVSNERVLAAIQAIALEARDGAPRDWKSIDTTDVVAALDRLRAARPHVLREPWSLRLKPIDDASGVEPAIDAAITTLLDIALAPALGQRAAIEVVDPNCGAGAVLLAAARRIRERSIAAPTMHSLVTRSLRACSRDATHVSLCRLALWLEAPTELDSGAALRACVRHARDGEEATMFTRESPAIQRRIVLTDIVGRERELLASAPRLLDRTSVFGAVVDEAIAWKREFAALRASASIAVTSAIEAPNPARAKRPFRLSLAARLSDVPIHRRWASRVRHPSAECDALLDHLSPFVTLDEAMAVEDERATATIQLQRRNGVLTATRERRRSKDALALRVSTSALRPDAWVAILNATAVRWQRALIDEARASHAQPLCAEDIYELAEPRLSPNDRRALDALGSQLEREGMTPALRARIDVIVFDGFAFDPQQKRLASQWLAERMTERDEPVQRKPRPSTSEEGPRHAASGPSSTGREDRASRVVGSSRDERRTSDSTASAQGRGAESALRARADDGRAAVVSGKRGAAQPMSAAEREAWAILVAAGPEGISQDELCRRAREHTSDELIEAIESLLAHGWLTRSEGPRRALRTARDAIARRARGER